MELNLKDLMYINNAFICADINNNLSKEGKKTWDKVKKNLLKNKEIGLTFKK